MAVLQSASAIVVASWLLGAAATAPAPQPSGPRLDFQVQEGLNINRLVREGNVAAHLLLRSGTDPRILIAFPAGNSGVGLWFAHRPGKASWMLQGRPRATYDSDRSGRVLYGISADAALEARSEEHTSELQSHVNLVCRLLLEKKKKKQPPVLPDLEHNRELET